jgi:hypothetical protein
MNFPDRVPGIPDFTPIFDLIREERILSAILGLKRINFKKARMGDGTKYPVPSSKNRGQGIVSPCFSVIKRRRRLAR